MNNKYPFYEITEKANQWHYSNRMAGGESVSSSACARGRIACGMRWLLMRRRLILMFGARWVNRKWPFVDLEVNAGRFGARHVIRRRAPAQATLHAHPMLVHLRADQETIKRSENAEIIMPGRSVWFKYWLNETNLNIRTYLNRTKIQKFEFYCREHYSRRPNV